MKVYADGLDLMLGKISGNAFKVFFAEEGFIRRLGSSINRSYQLSELMVRKGKNED